MLICTIFFYHILTQGLLYLFGGEFGFRDADEIPLWIFDTNKKSWRQLEIISEVKTPCSRRGHTAVVYQDALHVFGGYVDLKGAVNEFWSLDFGKMIVYILGGDKSLIV